MAINIKSDNSTDELRIDAASKAARVTLYDTGGNEINAQTPKAGVVIDSNNTSIVALTAGATYTGTATEILNYNQINVDVYGRPGVVAGDGSSAKASLFFEFSKDGSNWDISIPSLVRDPSLVVPVPLINVHRYFRVRYLNDGGVAAIAALGLTDSAGTPTTQTVFRLTTYLLPLATKELARTMDQGIQGSDACSLVRAGVMARNPSGEYVNTNQSGIDNLNSSTTVLGAGATFTGSFQGVLGYSNICVVVDSNLIGNFFIDFSNDGSTVVSTVTRAFNNVSAGQSYFFSPSTAYYRVRYTNIAGTQSFFRLQSVLKSSAVGSIFTPINTPLTINALGQIVVAVPSDGIKATFSASMTDIAPAASATDVFTITGSATRTIKVLRIFVSGVRTAATQTNVLLVKRSTANSGGTSASVTATPHDSVNSAATATVLSYTANPTTGTLVGTLRSRKIFVPASGTAAEGGVLVYDFGELGQSVVLRGTSQVLAVNFGGVTILGGSFNYTVEWIEE